MSSRTTRFGDICVPRTEKLPGISRQTMISSSSPGAVSAGSDAAAVSAGGEADCAGPARRAMRDCGGTVPCSTIRPRSTMARCAPGPHPGRAAFPAPWRYSTSIGWPDSARPFPRLWHTVSPPPNQSQAREGVPGRPARKAFISVNINLHPQKDGGSGLFRAGAAAFANQLDLRRRIRGICAGLEDGAHPEGGVDVGLGSVVQCAGKGAVLPAWQRRMRDPIWPPRITSSVSGWTYIHEIARSGALAVISSTKGEVGRWKCGIRRSCPRRRQGRRNSRVVGHSRTRCITASGALNPANPQA